MSESYLEAIMGYCGEMTDLLYGYREMFLSTASSLRRLEHAMELMIVIMGIMIAWQFYNVARARGLSGTRRED